MGNRINLLRERFTRDGTRRRNWGMTLLGIFGHDPGRSGVPLTDQSWGSGFNSGSSGSGDWGHVGGAPRIITNPSPQYAYDSDVVGFTISARGSRILIYKWQENTGSGWSDLSDAGNYSGTATPSLIILAATYSMDGYLYRCRVTNPYGAAISASASLTVFQDISCSALECRIRGGTASLVGHEAFSSPASPPGKWLNLSVSGYWQTCNWPDNACASLSGASDRMTYSGTCNYSAVTGAPTNALARSYGASITQPCTPPAGSAYDNPACDRPYNPDNGSNGDYTSGLTIGNTQTQRTWDYTQYGSCQPSGGVYRTWSGNVVWTLGTPDSDSNALSRLLAGAGGTWGSWIASGGVGCTGTPPSCCLARWEIRSSGFSFVYQESQYRSQQTGLTPGRNYAMPIKFYRRAYGSGSYTLFSTVLVLATADGSGNATFSGTVDNPAGFDTYASC